MIKSIVVWSFFVLQGFGQFSNPDFDPAGAGWDFIGPGSIVPLFNGKNPQVGSGMAKLDPGSTMTQTITAYFPNSTCDQNVDCLSNKCLSQQCAVSDVDDIQVSWWVIVDDPIAGVDWKVSYSEGELELELVHTTFAAPGVTGWVPYGGSFRLFQETTFTIKFEVFNDSSSVLFDSISYTANTPPPTASPTVKKEDNTLDDLTNKASDLVKNAGEDDSPIPGLSMLVFALIITIVALCCIVIILVVCVRQGMCHCCPCSCCEGSPHNSTRETELADLESNNDFSSSYGKKW